MCIISLNQQTQRHVLKVFFLLTVSPYTFSSHSFESSRKSFSAFFPQNSVFQKFFLCDFEMKVRSQKKIRTLKKISHASLKYNIHTNSLQLHDICLSRLVQAVTKEKNLVSKTNYISNILGIFHFIH